MFTILAIVISCLGLLGLISFSFERRDKRGRYSKKVLGASVPSILSLLSNELLKLVFLATLIACPVGWYVMSKWLQSFAYRIDVSWWTFALSCGLVFFIALLAHGRLAGHSDGDNKSGGGLTVRVMA